MFFPGIRGLVVYLGGSQENKPPKPEVQYRNFSKLEGSTPKTRYFQCVGGTPLDSLVLFDRGFLYSHQFSQSLLAARQKGHVLLDASGEENRKVVTVSEKSPNLELGGGFKDLWNVYLCLTMKNPRRDIVRPIKSRDEGSSNMESQTDIGIYRNQCFPLQKRRKDAEAINCWISHVSKSPFYDQSCIVRIVICCTTSVNGLLRLVAY